MTDAAILRRWSGTLRTEDRYAYAAYMAVTGLPDYRATPGNLGCCLLMRDLDDGLTEVTTLSLWASLQDILAFAGPDPTRARYYPEDRRFLVKAPTHVEHHDVAALSCA
jgi:heme-degrading monooxygenase HmoA